MTKVLYIPSGTFIGFLSSTGYDHTNGITDNNHYVPRYEDSYLCAQRGQTLSRTLAQILMNKRSPHIPDCVELDAYYHPFEFEVIHD